MNIKTKYHGGILINHESLLHFDKGIPGFPDETQFVLIPLTEDGLFQVLQSTANAEIGFIVTDPFVINKDYDFTLEDSFVEDLQIKNEKDVKVMVIITPHEPFNKSTANLQAPVIINSHNQHARQVILNNTNYQTKHPLFTEEQAAGKE